MCNYKTRKRRYSVGGSVLSGAGSGASIGATVGPWGALIGGIIGGIAGGISGHQGEVKKNRMKREQQRQLDEQNYIQDYNFLQAYNNQYNMAEGGVLPLDGGYAEQLSSDVLKFFGDSHEQGGIDIGNNIEVEGDETIKDTKVYSDRIKVREGFIEYLKEEGINISNSYKTYAQVSTKLAELKAKYEDKLNSNNPFSYNTGMIMTQRLDTYLEELFFDQEMKKAIKNYEK